MAILPQPNSYEMFVFSTPQTLSNVMQDFVVILNAISFNSTFLITLFTAKRMS